MCAERHLKKSKSFLEMKQVIDLGPRTKSGYDCTNLPSPRTVFELHELGALQEKIEQAISLGSNQIILDLHFKDGWDSCGRLIDI